MSELDIKEETLLDLEDGYGWPIVIKTKGVNSWKVSTSSHYELLEWIGLIHMVPQDALEPSGWEMWDDQEDKDFHGVDKFEVTHTSVVLTNRDEAYVVFMQQARKVSDVVLEVFKDSLSSEEKTKLANIRRGHGFTVYL